MKRILAATAAFTILLATGASAHDRDPSLQARAILPADATFPAPFPGVINTDPAPAPGATQPVGGFSALLADDNGIDYWAMPDNGFGSKANSRSFHPAPLPGAAELQARHGAGQGRDHALGSRPADPVQHRQ